MQIEKAVIGNCFFFLQRYLENVIFQLFIIVHQFTRAICYFLKNLPTFHQFLLFFLVINKTLQLNNLKTRTSMNANITVFVICVKGIIYLLLYKVFYRNSYKN